MGSDNEGSSSPTPSPVESSTTSTSGERDDQNVTRPGEHDVLCGRGGGTNNHSGNVKFRQLVNEHKLKYLAASKVDKPKVARDVVKLWRGLDPPGRFLARKDDSRKGPGSVKAEGNVWYDVGDKKAREKASQCLRERTPDVLPFVKEMQRQQDILTGQGMRLVEAQMRNMGDGGQSPPPSGGMNMNGMNGMNMNGMNGMNGMGMNGMNGMNGGMNGMNGMGMNGMNGMNGGMNGMNGMNAAAAAAAMNAGINPGMPSQVHSMSESAVQNAFSTEYMFTHGFADPSPEQHGSAYANDPLSLSQMSQDHQAWSSYNQGGGNIANMNPAMNGMGMANMGNMNGMNPNMAMNPNIAMGRMGPASMGNQGGGGSSIEPVPLPSGFPKAAAVPQGGGNVRPDNVGSGYGDFNGANGNGDELTLEEYQASMSGYQYNEQQQKQKKSSSKSKSKKKSSTVDGAAGKEERTKVLEEMQENSWVKSFYSIEGSKADESQFGESVGSLGASGRPPQPSSNAPKSRNASLDAALARNQKLSTSQGVSSRTMQTAASARSTGTAGMSVMSGMSMMSGMSDFTGASAASRDAFSRMTSNLSLMSEMTDISDTLRSLDLSTATNNKNSSKA